MSCVSVLRLNVACLTELSPWPLVGLCGVFGTLCAPLPLSQPDIHPLTPCCPSSSNICRWEVDKGYGCLKINEVCKSPHHEKDEHCRYSTVLCHLFRLFIKRKLSSVGLFHFYLLLVSFLLATTFWKIILWTHTRVKAGYRHFDSLLTPTRNMWLYHSLSFTPLNHQPQLPGRVQLYTVYTEYGSQVWAKTHRKDDTSSSICAGSAGFVGRLAAVNMSWVEYLNSITGDEGEMKKISTIQHNESESSEEL